MQKTESTRKSGVLNLDTLSSNAAGRHVSPYSFVRFRQPDPRWRSEMNMIRPAIVLSLLQMLAKGVCGIDLGT